MESKAYALQNAGLLSKVDTIRGGSIHCLTLFYVMGWKPSITCLKRLSDLAVSDLEFFGSSYDHDM